MKQYIRNLHARPTHEKRRYSMRAAAVAVAIIFLVWLLTLGVRLQGMVGGSASAANDTSSLSAMTAAVGSDVASKFGQIQSSIGAQAPSATPAEVLQVPPASGGAAVPGSN